LHIAVNGWFWDAPTTGSGQYTRRLVEAVASLEPSVVLTVLIPFTPTADRAPPGDSALSGDNASVSVSPQVKLHPHPVRRTKAGKVWWEQVTVPRLARQVAADLLHVPYWASPAQSRVPTVVTIHDLIPRLLPAYRGSTSVRLYTAMVSATAQRARLAITDSAASRRDIIDQLHLPPEGVRAIPLAVDETLSPTPKADDQAIRNRLGCPDDYVVYLGGFDVRKDLRSVMGAFAYVHAWQDEIGLVVAGRLPTTDTAFAPDPRRLAREAGLPEGAVTFLGFVDEEDKPALLRGAQALVFPSIYEGFGYPPLEAITCGTPVVGCNSSSIPEVVGDAGLLVAPGDVEGMAGALIQLLGDDGFHERLSGNAMTQARRFSWQATAKGTLDTYSECLSNAK